VQRPSGIDTIAHHVHKMPTKNYSFGVFWHGVVRKVDSMQGRVAHLVGSEEVCHGQEQLLLLCGGEAPLLHPPVDVTLQAHIRVWVASPKDDKALLQRTHWAKMAR